MLDIMGKDFGKFMCLAREATGNIQGTEELYSMSKEIFDNFKNRTKSRTDSQNR
jgi:hypothetical protein